MFCGHCGQPAGAGLSFCTGCGQPIQGAATRTAEPTQVPATGTAAGSGTCPHCGAVVDPGYAKCGTCKRLISGRYSVPYAQERAALAAQTACPHCGAHVEPGYAKCGSCRRLVGQQPSLTQVVEQQQAAQAVAAVTPGTCPHCGANVEPGYAKCGNCRQLLTRSQSPRQGPSSVRSALGAPPGQVAPSRTGTIVATLLLGPFGALWAANAAERARAMRLSGTPYWKAFWWTWLLGWLGSSVAYALIVGALLVGMSHSTP